MATETDETLLAMNGVQSANQARGRGQAWSGRVECGNPQCARGWLTLLKDRRRPFFEGRWSCSTACLRAMVRAAVRREAAEEVGIEERRHSHRVPLGLMLLEQGVVSQAELQRALERQRQAGSGRIGEWLMRECGVRQEQIMRALGMQWGCPVLGVAGFDPDRMALTVPRVLVEATGMLPLRTAAGRILYIAFADRPDASAAFAMERICGLKVESGLVDQATWTEIHRRLGMASFAETRFERAADAESMAGKAAGLLASTQPRASRLVRVGQLYWLRLWLEMPEGGLPRTRDDVFDSVWTVGGEQ